MRNAIVVSVLLVLIATGASVAQVAPLAPGTRTISVSGHGQSKAKPDTMIVAFSVQSKASSGDDCSRLQSEKTGRIVDALKKEIGDTGEVATGGFSLSQYNEPTDNAALQATAPALTWTCASQLDAASDRLESIGTMVQAGLDAGAWRVDQSGIREVEAPQAGASFGAMASDRSTGVPVNTPPKSEYYVLLDASARDTTPNGCVRSAARLIDRISRALRKEVGKDVRIRLSSFQINQASPSNPGQPFYQPPPLPSQRYRPVYHADTTVSATTQKLELLGRVIQAGMKAGAWQLNSVSFTLSADAAARKEAIADAATEAQSKAATLATSMGVKLGKVLSISTNAQVQPQVLNGSSFASSMQLSSAAAARTVTMPALPNEVGYTADLNATYEIQ